MVHIESAAETVAHEMGLPERWFNSDVQMRPDTLPDGYMRRRVFIGVYGMIRVFAVSRPDLIAMKVIAGRPQDLADLETLRVRSDEVEFVRDCIEGLHAKGTTPGQIQDAKEVLDSLQVFDDA